MFKKMRKVTETDCFDSCKFSKSHLASEKKKSPGKTLFTRKKGLILETITQIESNATKLLVDNLRKQVNCWVPGHNPVVNDNRCVTTDGSDHEVVQKLAQVAS
jgi:hypothetical protein